MSLAHHPIVPKHHPLPVSPVKGEVDFSVRGNMVQREWSGTSPLMGKAGRGRGNTHNVHPRASFIRSTPMSTRSGVTGVSSRGATA